MSKFKHAFIETDAGKQFILNAAYKTLTTSIQIHCNKKEINPGYDPIVDDKISGSFPMGLSDSYFSIIYHTSPLSTSALANTLDLNELNEAARIYLNYVYEDSIEDFSDKTYYGQDSNGIFVVIPIQENEAIYNNDIYKYNDDGTPASYKVYIAGTCDVVDIGTLPNNIRLTLANGYYYNIENTLYLFLNTKLNMVCFSTDNGSTNYNQFWYKDDEENKKNLISNLNYFSDSYYLKHSDSKLATNLDLNNGAMMITGGVIDLIVTSNTITKIEHFSASPNVDTVILSDNLIEIGDYAFANGSLSGTVSVASEVSHIEKIGKYAFYKCPNIKLFQNSEGNTILPRSIKYIDDYAFYEAPGLKTIDFSNCVNLLSVGREAFGGCSNLDTVTYLQNQIEPDKDNNTRLLYLPPDKGTDGNYAPRISGKSERVTANYRYDYTNWINEAENDEDRNNRIAERDAADNNYVFKGSGPSVIRWNCK